MPVNIVGSYLKRKRIESELSQIELGKALGFMSAQYISNWERGVCNASANHYVKLVQLLNLDRNELIDLVVTQTRIDLNNLLFKQARARKNRRKK